VTLRPGFSAMTLGVSSLKKIVYPLAGLFGRMGTLSSDNFSNTLIKRKGPIGTICGLEFNLKPFVDKAFPATERMARMYDIFNFDFDLNLD